MTPSFEIKRRAFLSTASGAVGCASLLAGLSHVTGLGAETGAANSTAQRAAAENVLAEIEGKGPQFLSVPRKDGQFLNLLIKATRARHVLEVGTSHGYSSLWIALALEETGGHLTTIEIKPERVKLAQEHLGRAGLAQRVAFKTGDAHKIVPTLDGPFDLAFFDADKEGQMDYFNKVFPKRLAPGGVLAVHNAIRLRDSMADFLDMIAKHPDFDSVILSLTMEDGFSVSYRRRG
jgi:predicted O-methyltransferase YrrM